MDGHKWYTTGGGAAAFLIVMARTSDDPRMGATMFVVDRHAENAEETAALIGDAARVVAMGINLALEDWDHIGRDMPCLVNLQPSGHYLMEDFYYSGGLPAVLREILPLLHGNALTANGRTLAQNVADAPCYNRDVIRSIDQPFKEKAGIAVVKGNLAPHGAVIKPSAASSHLLKHRGRAVVFESIEDLRDRVDNPALDIDEHCVMVLKNCGPCGYPGMAEVGNMPLPRKILQKGITDMVRISDARMSGTAYGTVVLHTSPEAAVGGPLALVRTGDMIALDVGPRSLHLDVSDEELQRRKVAWVPPPMPAPGPAKP